MTNAHVVFSTIGQEEKAEELARSLVNEHLAACVNIVGGVTSVYRWQGQVVTEREWILIIKTSSDMMESLLRRLRELHPYEVPEAISLHVDHGYLPYLEWLEKETRRRF